MNTSGNYTPKEPLIVLKLVRSAYYGLDQCPVINGEELGGVLRIIRRNRVEAIVLNHISAKCPGNALIEELRGDADRILALRSMRNKLIHELSRIFEDKDIDYVIFKTINPSGAVGVDVDVLINPAQYWKAVNALIGNGFKPIDDLRKTYATGFVKPGNSVIIDLHTKLTIGGVEYMDSYELLKAKVMDMTLKVPVLEPCFDAHVRALHALIKESELKLQDAYDMLILSRKCNEEGLTRLAREPAFKASAILLGDQENAIGSADADTLEFVTSYLRYGLARLSILRRIINTGGVVSTSNSILNFVNNLIRYRRNITHFVSMLLNNLIG